MRHGSLFSGIGGFDLASEWMGWENVFHCEWNEFGQKVLKYYWPKAISYGDITKTDFTIHRGRIDILTGGFPCQPFSAAGKRKGTEDARHLWPQMLRAIREIHPAWIVGENVRGFTNCNGGLVFDQVFSDLETEGYEVTPFLLPACAVDAPHRRDRIWIVAHRNDKKQSEKVPNGRRHISKQVSNNGKIRGFIDGIIKTQSTPNATSLRQPREEYGQEESGRPTKTSVPNDWQNFPTQPPVCSRNDGLPSQLSGITFPKHRNESIKGYGNAIVPAIAFEIFKSIQAYDGEFMAEDVREKSRGIVPAPPSLRSWGSVIRKAAFDGLIRKTGTGTVKNPIAHRANAATWRRI